jgi:hypothetical protein
MATVINEYPLTDPRTVVQMAYDGSVLTVQVVDDVPTMFARVNPNSQQSERVFVTFASAQPIGDGSLSYVGTYQLPAGDSFHVFEGDPAPVE